VADAERELRDKVAELAGASTESVSASA